MVVQRAIVNAFLAAVACLAPAMARDGGLAPDFSGRWQLDLTTRSDDRPSGRAFSAVAQVNISSPSHPIGRVVIEGILDVDGRMIDVEVVASLTTRGFPDVLHRAAINEVHRRSRTPVRIDGVAVPSWLSVTTIFREDPRREPTGSLAPVGHDLEITQDATSLTCLRHTVMGRQTTTYRFDGTPTKTRLVLSHVSSPPWEHRSRWEDDALVTASAASDRRRTERTETRRRDSDTMIVETTWATSGVDVPLVRTQIYKRIGHSLYPPPS